MIARTFPGLAVFDDLAGPPSAGETSAVEVAERVHAAAWRAAVERAPYGPAAAFGAAAAEVLRAAAAEADAGARLVFSAAPLDDSAAHETRTTELAAVVAPCNDALSLVGVVATPDRAAAAAVLLLHLGAPLSALAEDGATAGVATITLPAAVSPRALQLPLDEAIVFDEVLTALATHPDAPASSEGPDALVAWSAATAMGGYAPVPRYFEQLRLMRHDLLVAYPEVPGLDAGAFCEWISVYGCAERGVPPDRFAPAVTQPEASGYDQAGVNLVGMFTAELGMAEVARRIAWALDAAHVPYTRITYLPDRHERTRPAPPTEARRYDTNVVCLNPDSLPRFTQQVGTGFFAGRRTAGVWFWETDRLSPMFHSSYRSVDELWAASDFVAAALAPDAPPEVPVVRFPMPIVRPERPPGVGRAQLAIPPDRFVFLTSFDYRSVMARKNPIGAITAFRDAFAAGEGPVLVVKSTNAASDPKAVEQVAEATAGRSDIVLRDELLSEADNIALLATADCFVSLHRSEGLGFNLADAIALGVPLISTAATGNMAFCRPQHVWLIDAVETAVGEGHHPYEATSRWFEPDLTQATAAMRAVVGEPEAAAARAADGAAWIVTEFSPERAGRFVRDHLAVTRAARESPSPTTPADPPAAQPGLLTRLRTKLQPSRRS